MLISGDVYIDGPFDGIAVIGKYLMKHGYRVGVISQPDPESESDITRLGEPILFWGVSSGAVDSMVANYTALKKRKNSDDLTPGGINNRRPDRALIKYCNMIRRSFKNTVPIVIGGIEASLRRVAHYDYWSDTLRRSVLVDAKADILVYGMGERAILDVASALKDGRDYRDTRGICYISSAAKNGFTELPSFDEVKADKMSFISMFNTFYKNNDPLNATGLYQNQGARYVIQNPPAQYLEGAELDDIYEMDFEYDAHPYYKSRGTIKALDTIKFSITSHRGCFGECNFCAIAVHQGRRIRSRGEESIIREATRLSNRKDFKGYIYDVGGATANMFGMKCDLQESRGACREKRCISDAGTCKNMNIDHSRQTRLLSELRKIPGIKKIFIGSGVRYDLILEDTRAGREYLAELVRHHVSGQMKIAPEHTQPNVLKAMGKPLNSNLSNFREEFLNESAKAGLKQYLTYYFIAAHPGCDYQDMENLKEYVKKELKIKPEQVQVFTPTPSTYSTLMYYTGLNPFTMKGIFVEKDSLRKEDQKLVLFDAKAEKVNVPKGTLPGFRKRKGNR